MQFLQSYFFNTQQRFPTEDHLMIHRHKHEMTLKFPSIKNDNMLSGELWLHQYRLAHYLSRVHGELIVHLQVCALVTQAPTHLSIIRKLYGVSIPVVYSNVNHMTHVTLAQLYSVHNTSTHFWRTQTGWRILEKSPCSISLPCCFV